MWAVAEHNQNSLAAFRRRVHWRADTGKVRVPPQRVTSCPCIVARSPADSLTATWPSGGGGLSHPSMRVTVNAMSHRLHAQAGGGSKCHGADGDDLEVPVPPGTIVRSRDAADGDAPIAELLQPGALRACAQPLTRCFASLGEECFAHVEFACVCQECDLPHAESCSGQTLWTQASSGVHR